MSQSQVRGVPKASAWHGWVAFAATIMVVNGFFNLIQGLTALIDDDFYVVTSNHLLTFDLTTWGWIHLILGVVLLVVGFALYTEKVWALIASIGVVMLHLIAQFGFVSAYPVWSVVAIAIDVIILWALMVHGGEYAS